MPETQRRFSKHWSPSPSRWEKLTEKEETAEQIAENWLTELVADKGYHSNETMVDLQEFEIRSYISEPKRGRRNWSGKATERAAVYANRRADSR